MSLGVNTHSQGMATMYKPGERPADPSDAPSAAAQTTEKKENYY